MKCLNDDIKIEGMLTDVEISPEFLELVDYKKHEDCIIFVRSGEIL